MKNILVANLDRLPEEQPAEVPGGQQLFRLQRQAGYFDAADEKVS